MSTYYYLLCDTHKEFTDAASRTAGGHCPLGDGVKTLLPFIIAHRGCAVRIVSEHDRAYEEIFVENEPSHHREWKEENVAAEIEAAEKDGRWL